MSSRVPGLKQQLRWLHRNRLMVALLLCIVGAGWRLLVILLIGERVPRGLFAEVVNIARSLAGGMGFANAFGPGSGPTAHTTPVYPLLLSLVIRLFGDQTETVMLWVTGAFVVGAGAVVLLWPGRYGFGPLTALLCALAMAFVTINPRVEVFGWFENQMASLVVAVYAGLAYKLSRKEGASPFQWGGLGIAGGAAMLTSGVLTGPVLFSWLYCVWRHRRRGTDFAVTLAAPLAAVVVLSPWVIRNWAVLGKPVMLRSNLGLELAISNRPNAGALEWIQAKSGAYRKFHPHRGRAERERYVRLGEIPYMEEKFREAMAWIRSNPGKFAVLTAQRAQFFFFHTGPRPFPTVVLMILTIAGIAGMALDLHANPYRAVFYGGIVLSFACVYFVVQIAPRYRLPINWIFALYASHLIRVLLRFWIRSFTSPTKAVRTVPKC